MTVSDDGNGLPKDFNLKSEDSLGLTLVSNLAEKQLNGNLNIQNGRGTEFQVSFPEAVTGRHEGTGLQHNPPLENFAV